MTDDTGLQEHVVAALRGAEICRVPFPHFYVQNVFPAPFYAELQASLAAKTDFHSEKFANRTFADDLGVPALDFMLSRDFFTEMLHLFDSDLKERFGGTNTSFYRELRLIRDSQNYKIGPHTDAQWKVLSLLFYLPPDDSNQQYGTSVYVPRNASFRCPGGPHHPFEQFREVWRAPYRANSCLGFWKTDHSFHGVEPIPTEIRRDVLLYNIYNKQPPKE